jgi:tRNA nucleotidyltransferase (CCA-adding enzyme)
MRMTLPQAVLDVASGCQEAGGRAWVVGGVVRDTLLNIDSKDIDIEVHALHAKDLVAVLRKFGPVNEIGKSFGVFKLVCDGVEMDVSIPRRDSQRGPRHKDVHVEGDPHMGIEAAARRRDLTINAIAYDPLSQEYADPFGGIRDIERGRLVAVDPMTFLDDPLRALRVIQFAARFGFSVHADLVDLCILAKIAALPGERLWGELEKLLMRAPIPSVGWTLAHRTRLLPQVLPEVAQAPLAHMEGALDRAAEMRDQMGGPGRATALMLATMLHTTEPKEATTALDRLKVFTLHGYPVRRRVLEAVAHWRTLCTPCSDSVLRHFSDQSEVLLVATTAWAATGDTAALANVDRADRLGIAEAPAPPLLQGRDLQALGIDPGRRIGVLLAHVRQAQNDGTLNDRSQAMAWLRERISKED